MENIKLIKNYRPEIDGLRAIAVISVIVNHFNKDILPSGFLGVDIFFVISGYVITSSLARRKSKDFFEFISTFYARRIKRLIPALILFVLVISFLISFFSNNPNTALKTGGTSLFGVSNFYLYKNSINYFSESTELNPFTHTWSLGVEEQFYFIFPFLIWATGFARHKKDSYKNLFLIILVLSIISLTLFIYLSPVNQPAAYFLMPSRFWEMATGCLVFIKAKKRVNSQKSLFNIDPLFFLIAIILIMFLPISYSVISTISIVTLSSILIYYLREDSNIFKFLSNKILVSIGLMSYSLYLWHWGVISISRWTIGIYWWSIPFQIVLIFILSKLSYKLIELPFRKNDSERNLKTNSKGLIAIFISTLTLLALAKPLKGKLYLGRINAEESHFIDDLEIFTGRKRDNCTSSDEIKIDSLKGNLNLTSNFIKNCLVKKSDQLPLISFVGDSHTGSIFPISEKLFQDYRINLFNHNRPGCVFPEQGRTNRYGCYEVMRSTENFILNELDKDYGGGIIAMSYLNSHFGYYGGHSKQFIPEDQSLLGKILLGRFFQKVDKNLTNYISELDNLSQNLKKNNAFLIVVAPLPQHPFFIPEICSKQWFRPHFSISKGCKKTDRSYLEKERMHIINALKKLELERSNFYIYDPFNQFCDQNYCYVGDGNKVFYSDNNHLSLSGAYHLYPSFIEFLNSKNILSDYKINRRN